MTNKDSNICIYREYELNCFTLWMQMSDRYNLSLTLSLAKFNSSYFRLIHSLQLDHPLGSSLPFVTFVLGLVMINNYVLICFTY